MPPYGRGGLGRVDQVRWIVSLLLFAPLWHPCGTSLSLPSCRIKVINYPPRSLLGIFLLRTTVLQNRKRYRTEIDPETGETIEVLINDSVVPGRSTDPPLWWDDSLNVVDDLYVRSAARRWWWWRRCVCVCVCVCMCVSCFFVFGGKKKTGKKVMGRSGLITPRPSFGLATLRIPHGCDSVAPPSFFTSPYAVLSLWCPTGLSKR